MLTQFPRWARSLQLRAQTISSHFFGHTADLSARAGPGCSARDGHCLAVTHHPAQRVGICSKPPMR
jgi:hypothetical protein